MSTPMRGRAAASRWFAGWGWYTLPWVAAGALSAVLIAYPAPRERAEEAACDRAVATLLETRDPIELQRADMLVRHLRCSVGRRLPREP